MTATVFTIGYSGFSPARFAAKLKAAGVTQLIDVRRNPVSRKQGFSKAGLSGFLQDHGIEYHHEPALGVPDSLRNELRDGGNLGDYLHQFGQYLETCDDVLTEMLDLIKRRPCCLMCLEKNPAECHRSVVAKELRARANGELTIDHLRLDNATVEFDFE